MKRMAHWEDMMLTAQYLTAAVRMNLSLDEALKVLSNDLVDKRFRAGLYQAGEQVAAGKPLAEALAVPALRLPKFFLSIIRMGEASHTLTQGLELLQTMLNRSFFWQQKAKEALVYPLIIAILISTVFIAQVTFVFPMFSQMLHETELSTEAGLMPHQLARRVMDFSLSGVGFFVVVSFLVGCVLSLYVISSPSCRLPGVRYWGPKVPVIGRLFTQMELAMVTRALAGLLKGAVPVTQALRHVREITMSTYTDKCLDRLAQGIEKSGELTPQLLKTSRFLPVPMVWLMVHGKEQMELAQVFEHLAEYYENRLETMLTIHQKLLEPILVLCIGVVVCLAIIAMFTPQFEFLAMVFSGM